MTRSQIILNIQQSSGIPRNCYLYAPKDDLFLKHLNNQDPKFKFTMTLVNFLLNAT